MVETIRRLCKEQGKNLFSLEQKCGLGNGSINKWDRSSPCVCVTSNRRARKKARPHPWGGLDPELVELIKRIPADRMPEVERYLRFQAEQEEKS